MDVDQFWKIIEDSRGGASASDPNGNMDRQIAQLTAHLASLPSNDVADFDRHFVNCMATAYRWDLWAAAYIINGGCSDDGFIDFRSWLISMGRTVFEASLGDVESLVNFAKDPTVEDCSFEEFQYVAGRVYGEPIDHEIDYPPEPTGEPWDEESDELADRFPILWAAFGE